MNAALASEPFRTAWQNFQTRAADQVKSDWRRLRTGEQIALVSTGAAIALTGLAGVTLTDDPSARQLLLSQLNGKTIPIPKASWLRVEVNTSGDAIMFGMHADVGALLGPRFGFRASSPSAIGGPPQAQSALPPAVQRSLNSLGGLKRLVAVQRDDATAPKPPQAKAGRATTTFKSASDTWTVTAKTLKEAADQIMARDEAGETSWSPVYNVTLDENGKTSGVAAEVTITVLMPNWPGAANLKGEDKKKWEDFMNALKRHEAGHVALVKQKLDGIAGRMKGKTESDAADIWQKALDDLKDASDKYDKKNDHGRKEGTIIQTEDEEPSGESADQKSEGSLFGGALGLVEESWATLSGIASEAAVSVQRQGTTAPADAGTAPATKSFDEIVRILNGAPTGQEALAIRQQYSVKVNLKPNVGIGYYPDTNTVNLDATRTPQFLALAFAHEMNHAKIAKDTKPSAERAKTMSKDEFVKSMLKEEAESDVKTYDVKYELQNSDVDLTDALPSPKDKLEQLYRDTIINEAIRARLDDPAKTGTELLKIGKATGKQAVIDRYQNGPEGQRHREHYEKQWDSANAGN